MGEKITRRPKSADLERAKFLKQALQQGSPPALTSPETAPKNLEPGALAWSEDHPEVHRAFLEQLVECTPEAISILNTRYCVTRINSEFTRMFGYSSEEALGQRIDTLIVPPDRNAETRWIAETVEKGQKVSLETKRRRKDGTLLDVSISSSPVLIGDSKAAIYVLYRDISDQKRAEAVSSALYRIAERTSSAEDLQQFFAAIHNIVGELMYARNLYIALYDPATQLLSFPYFVDEQDPTPAPKKLGRGLTEHVLRTGEPLLATPHVFEELVRRGEAELIGAPSLDWMGVPLKAGNNTFGVLVVQSYSEKVRFGERDRDILMFVSQQLASAIEHKRNEEALRRSEARYRSLVQSAVYGLYRSSVEGKFLDVNPALISMLAYDSPDEVLALNPKTDVFLNPEEQSHLMEEFRRNGRLDSVEVQWKRRDGSPIMVRLSGRAVTTPEEPEEVLEIIAEDVTERRVLEDQFRQAQKMEAVGRLAGGVAHDFNNLLMVIGGYTEVLLEQLDPGTSLHQKALAVQQAADRATTLTRQLLAFSRKQLLELKVVDVNTIVSDMERLLRPLIGENIELTTKLTAGPGRTRADAGQLEQVIMNLVVNAKDAMPDGGKIAIQTANVTLDGSLRREHTFIAPGSYVMLSVTDTGLGMDKETQSRVFEPFFTTKEKGKGTGLGLSTVYGIVKQSGGYIFAQSEVGRGTTFTIYLPQVDDASDNTGPANVSHVETGGSETVLLVEDEESVRQLVRETLVSKGYTVIEAENGEAGLRIAENHQGPIHMVITDVVMPGMSGRELAKRLTQVRPHTKVLYLSGYTEDAIVHQGVLDTGTAFLQKPFTLQILSRKVREVMRGESS
ncbi:MAG TPA: PAS domain S-box protein [Terriglobales bacterium]|nr:PAS domain S-box protein [Terriglobales bacterium]